MATPITTLKKRLTEALALSNMRPIELSSKTGIPKSSISQYMSGYSKPNSERVYLISKALNVSEAWLMGYDVPMEREHSTKLPDNIIPIKTKKLPMLGNIACGEPVFANEEYGEYIDVDGNINADFCLRAKGDSMTGARIQDGDIVFIKKQDTIENGEIAAVLIEDEATLKRVQYDREEDILRLFAENPRYKTMSFSGEKLNQIKIGRASLKRISVQYLRAPKGRGASHGKPTAAEPLQDRYSFFAKNSTNFQTSLFLSDILCYNITNITTIIAKHYSKSKISAHFSMFFSCSVKCLSHLRGKMAV